VSDMDRKTSATELDFDIYVILSIHIPYYSSFGC
jgi:hypothetical protein